MATKKLSPLQSARKSYNTAKADLKAGKKGASERLDKSVTRIAKLSCSTKPSAKKSSKKKKKAAPKKRKAAKRK